VLSLLTVTLRLFLFFNGLVVLSVKEHVENNLEIRFKLLVCDLHEQKLRDEQKAREDRLVPCLLQLFDIKR
jgi:hypothetical protein